MLLRQSFDYSAKMIVEESNVFIGQQTHSCMITVSLNTSEFDKAMEEYRQFSKRNPSEIINAKCSFIAKNATQTTKKANRELISAELDAPSNTSPSLTVGQVIVIRKAKLNGEKIPKGDKLNAAVDKLKRLRFRSIAFLRSGWLPAIRILDLALKRGDISFSNRFSPKVDRSTKQYGKDKGTAIWAKPTERTFGQIENWVHGNGNENRVDDFLLEGLQKAIDKEVASMRTYIETKLNLAHAKFNNGSKRL